MRNYEVTTVQRLLTAEGSLREPGWSRRPFQAYRREDIRTSRLRIKEWDYYIVLSKTFGCAFTISDDGYIGLQSVTFFDFTAPAERTGTILNWFPRGKFGLPPTSEAGTVAYRDRRLEMEFTKGEGWRTITCYFHKFGGDGDLYCEIRLEEPHMDSMVIATPWKEDRKAFYYNRKINCMRASGRVVFGGKDYIFSPDTDFGTLDWGRGVWTYDNTWYWGSGNAVVGGKPFGFNIGYGFGDTSAATENILFYDGVGHKLDDVMFNIPERSWTDPWSFSSSDGRFEMDFHPILDRAAKIDAGIILTDQHQVFGRMSGNAVLDDGTVLEVRDLLCFAEKVHNRY